MASSRKENHTRRVTRTRLRDKAMENQQKVVESLTVVSFKALDFGKSHFPNPQDMTDFLESRGWIVTDKPSEDSEEAGAAMEKEKVEDKTKDKSHPPVRRTKEEECQRFTEKYPLTVEKEPPPLKRCFAEFKVHGKYLYDRWRNLQNTMRVDYVIGLLQDHRPDEEVKKYIGHQMWQSNLPRVKEISSMEEKTPLKEWT